MSAGAVLSVLRRREAGASPAHPTSSGSLVVLPDEPVELGVQHEGRGQAQRVGRPAEHDDGLAVLVAEVEPQCGVEGVGAGRAAVEARPGLVVVGRAPGGWCRLWWLWLGWSCQQDV